MPDVHLPNLHDDDDHDATRPIAAKPQRHRGIARILIDYDDVVISEPKLIELYDALLPEIDRALGE